MLPVYHLQPQQVYRVLQGRSKRLILRSTVLDLLVVVSVLPFRVEDIVL
jgi:hypothetical protein